MREYPLFRDKKRFDKLVFELQNNGVEIRPLVCGSIGEQPFWKNIKGITWAPFAYKIHNHGLYLPNNPQIKKKEIEFICNIINNI
jgi:CDP-6-deoxy-D-xylo-4-hexulose-3-dehydrase